MSLWNTIIQNPLYNGLVGIVSVVPFHDIGTAVIILTILVRLVLFPLSKKSIQSQIKMRAIQPELDRIKKEFPDKKEQAAKQFELYKKYGINPFSGCLPLLIQLPIIIGLYNVFRHGIPSETNPLYSFVSMPETINMNFLGVLPLDEKSIAIAVLVAISQYFQAKIMPAPATTGGDEASFQVQMAKSMRIQMVYVLPLVMGFFAYQISAAIGLYLLVTNLFTIGQELYVRKRMGNFVLTPKNQ